MEFWEDSQLRLSSQKSTYPPSHPFTNPLSHPPRRVCKVMIQHKPLNKVNYIHLLQNLKIKLELNLLPFNPTLTMISYSFNWLKLPQLWRSEWSNWLSELYNKSKFFLFSRPTNNCWAPLFFELIKDQIWMLECIKNFRALIISNRMTFKPLKLS